MMTIISKFFETIGKKAIKLFEETGNLTILSYKTILWVFKKPFSVRAVFYQMSEMGVNSIPVIIITSLSTGMVLALQTGVTLEAKIQGMSQFMGGVVSLSMCRELGPVLTALIVTGRVCSAIAAEIGTMKVTEQIDALHTLATNPIQYLAVPRLLAGIIMLPILTLFSDFIGILGGLFISTTKLSMSSTIYVDSVFQYLKMPDITNGLIKTVFFGMIIAIVGCYMGFNTEGGAEGVGKSTTKAVVLSSMLILIFDYLLTAMLF
jgi:phospholipid/cholesterol/gamma-HCH transport system permease protein